MFMTAVKNPLYNPTTVYNYKINHFFASLGVVSINICLLPVKL